jgi:hypothetical protein
LRAARAVLLGKVSVLTLAVNRGPSAELHAQRTPTSRAAAKGRVRGAPDVRDEPDNRQ